MVIVIAEQRDGQLNRATWEAIAAAQQAGDEPVKIVVIGSGIDAAAADVAAANAAEVIVIDHPALQVYTPDGYVAALAAALAAEQPSLVFLPHTYQTRDFAPAHAARLGRALMM